MDGTYTFEVGDIVRQKSDCNGTKKDNEYEVFLEDYGPYINSEGDDCQLVIKNGKLPTRADGSGCHCLSQWVLVRKGNLKNNSNNKSIMATLKDTFRLAFKSEPEKSFQKAQITNGSDELTPDGVTVFLGWLLKKHGDDFKKEVVDPILAEMEKESK